MKLQIFFTILYLFLLFSLILQSLTENSPTGIESEYDTASTNSRSDHEHEEYDDDDEADEEDSVIDEDGTGECRNLTEPH